MVTNRALATFMVLISIFFQSNLFSFQYGSDSFSQVMTYTVFPSAQTNNEILAFAWMKNGFALEDNATSVTFSSAYPVSGTVNLNGGTLSLNSAFIFHDLTNLAGGGVTIGNDNTMQLCSTITWLPYDTTSFEGIYLILANDVVISSTITFKGNCIVYGYRNALILEDNLGAFVVAPNSTLELKNLEIRGVKNDNVACVDDSSSIILNSVRWVQSGDVAFSNGSILFQNGNDFAGGYKFSYESALTSTIAQDSAWTFNRNTTLSIGRKELQNFVEPLVFENNFSTLKFDASNLIVTATGMQVTKGNIAFDRNSSMSIMSTSSVYGLILGNAQEADDPTLNFNSGASMDFITGCFVYNCYNPGRVKSTSKGAYTTRFNDSIAYVAQNWILPPWNLKVVGAPQTIMAQDKVMSFDDVHLIFPMAEFDFLGSQDASQVFYLRGNEYLYLTKGIVPIPLVVTGQGNELRGNGNVGVGIILADENSELFVNLEGTIYKPLTLNGGTLSIGSNLYLGEDADLETTGTMQLNGYQCALGAQDFEWTGTTMWKGNDGAISLSANINLTGQWIFDSNCTINGYGNTIDLKQTGSIIIKSGAKVTFRELFLRNVHETNIHCEDDSASIVLDGITWVQSDDFTFDTGSIIFSNHNDFLGAYTFFYESSQTSTINTHAEWNINQDFTLSIGRQEIVNIIEPLYFADSSAALKFDAATLAVTDSGMQVTNGKVIFDRASNMDIVSTNSSYGFILGNAQAAHDPVLLFNSGASLNFNSGNFVYNCSAPDCVQASSKSAYVTRFGNSFAYVAQNWTLPPWNLVVSGSPRTQMAPGKALSYNDVKLIFGIGEFDFNGSQDANQFFYLRGNQYIYLTKGIVPVPLVVIGTGNEIRGTGNLGQPVILQNSAAQVLCTLDGTVFSSFIMNSGTVKLVSNLYLGEEVQFSGKGTVDLDAYQCSLGAQDFTWTGSTNWYGNSGSLSFNSNVELTSTWTFNGECILNGYGFVLDLTATGSIVVAPNSVLTLKNVFIKHIGENNIRCVDDSASIILDDVYWIQDAAFTFDAGSLLFKNYNEFTGQYSFYYTSGQTSTISSHAQWAFTEGMSLSIGRKEVINFVEPLYFEDATSIIKFDNASLIVTATGMQCTNGKMLLDHKVAFDIMSTSSQYGLIHGDGQEGHDFILYFNSGASLSFNMGNFVYNNYTPDRVQTASKNAYVTRYGDSYAFVAQPWTLPPWQLKVIGVPRTAINLDGLLEYDDVNLIFSGAEFDFTGAQDGNQYFYLRGDEYVYLSKGTLPVPLIVSGTGNEIRGSGNIGQVVMLQDSSAELYINLNGLFLQSISLNGGTVILSGDMNFGNLATFLDAGNINVGISEIDLGVVDTQWTSTLGWNGTNGTISIHGTVELLGTWTFSGDCTINGNGSTLDLSLGGQIVVADNSTLIIRHTHLTGVTGTNIRCLGNNSKLVLDEVTWIQSGDYTFDLGSLEFDGSVRMMARDNQFNYRSTSTSTVDSGTTLHFDPGFTFNYDPADGNKELLAFVNDSSMLCLNGALITTGTSGMTFLNGKLVVTRDSRLETSAPMNEGGISFGDDNSAHDMKCEILEAVRLCFCQGAFLYHNVNSSSWRMLGPTSRLDVDFGVNLNLYQSIALHEGVIMFQGNNILGRATGADIDGSIFVLGTLNYEIL